jgi:ankyrin repeat protein
MKNFCIQKFANIQSDSCARGTALIQIIRDGDHKELIDCLFNNGIPIAFPPSQLHEPFLAAIETGDFELARRLAARVDVNLQDTEGRTLLSLASRGGLEDLALFLLKDLHADVNLVDNEAKTALFYASKCHYNIVRYIVAAESFDVKVISSSVQPREDIP